MTAKEVNVQRDIEPTNIADQAQSQRSKDLNMDYSKYDFKDSTELYVYLSKKGLSRGTVEEISKLKGEPDWMRDFRLRAYDVFLSKPMPSWGGDLSKIDFQNIYYYAKASEKQVKTWDDVPASV